MDKDLGREQKFLDSNHKVIASNTTHSLVLLVVLGAPGLGHEAFGELLQVARVLHLDLGLLAEEVLEVLKELDPHVCLLLQTFLLFHQLGSNL